MQRCRTRNCGRIFAISALPADDFRRLLPSLKTVPIRLKQVLHKNGEPLRVVYSLNGGVAAMTTVLRDGTQTVIAQMMQIHGVQRAASGAATLRPLAAE